MPRTTTKKTTKTVKKPPVKKTAKKPMKVTKATVEDKPKKATKKLPYIQVVGKRKTAVARVRFYPKDNRGDIIINEKSYKEFFPYFEFQSVVEKPLRKVNLLGKHYITIKIAGGGKRGQADAVAHGIARALLKFNEEFKKALKSEKLLTRDARKKERKKPGLKRARRAPQWAKR